MADEPVSALHYNDHFHESNLLFALSGFSRLGFDG